MKEVNDLVLVIENYSGSAERNILYTKDEFLNYLQTIGMAEVTRDVQLLLDTDRACFAWQTLLGIGGSLEFRRCRDENDLCAFFEGRYNDSAEKMRARGLILTEKHEGFQCELDVSSFSPGSVHLCHVLQRNSPQLKEWNARLFSRSVSLDDVLRNCQRQVEKQTGENYKSSVRSDFNTRGF